MSKVRQPTMPTPNPAKTTPAKSTAATRGVTPAPRGAATIKPRVGLAGAKLKDGKAKAAAATAVGAAAAVVGKETIHHDEEPTPQDVPSDASASHESHEHEGSGGSLVDEPEHVEHHEPEEMVEGEGHDVQHEDVLHVEPEQPFEEHHVEEHVAEPETIAHEETSEPEEHSPVESEQATPEVAVHPADDIPAPSAEAEAEAEAEVEVVVSEAEPESEANHSEGETHVDTESDTVAGSVVADKSSNDLEDMVAFLEAAPVQPRPTSVVVPDEVADIPDED